MCLRAFSPRCEHSTMVEDEAKRKKSSTGHRLHMKYVEYALKWSALSEQCQRTKPNLKSDLHAQTSMCMMNYMFVLSLFTRTQITRKPYTDGKKASAMARRVYKCIGEFQYYACLNATLLRVTTTNVNRMRSVAEKKHTHRPSRAQQSHFASIA